MDKLQNIHTTEYYFTIKKYLTIDTDNVSESQNNERSQIKNNSIRCMIPFINNSRRYRLICSSRKQSWGLEEGDGFLISIVVISHVHIHVNMHQNCTSEI